VARGAVVVADGVLVVTAHRRALSCAALETLAPLAGFVARRVAKGVGGTVRIVDSSSTAALGARLAAFSDSVVAIWALRDAVHWVSPLLHCEAPAAVAATGATAAAAAVALWVAFAAEPTVKERVCTALRNTRGAFFVLETACAAGYADAVADATTSAGSRARRVTPSAGLVGTRVPSGWAGAAAGSIVLYVLARYTMVVFRARAAVGTLVAARETNLRLSVLKCVQRARADALV